MTRRIVLVLFIAFWPAACAARDSGAARGDTTDYFAPKNVLMFADHLYDTGDYLRAAGEYRRYLFLSNASAGDDSVYYMMTNALFLGKDYSRCLQALDRFSEAYPASRINERIGLCGSIVRYYQRDYAGSLRLALDAGASASVHKTVVVTMNYIHLGDFDEAIRWSCGSGVVANSTNAKATLDALCEAVSRARALPHKNRMVAAVLSGMVPGAGKAFCGRIADGAYSLLVVGLAAWQAYDGFDDDGTESVKGWVLGTLGAGLYLGNIYGSAVCADLYNRRIRDEFIGGLTVEISLP